jgi:hypothetical protein
MVVVFVLVLIIIVAMAVAACKEVKKCPKCGAILDGPFGDTSKGEWHKVWYCPHCHREWF